MLSSWPWLANASHMQKTVRPFFIALVPLNPSQVVLPGTAGAAPAQKVLPTRLMLFCLLNPCPARYYRCCGWRVDEDQGGVLWPLYHLCE